MLKGAVQVFTNGVPLHVELNASGAILHRSETGLAHDAFQHHAPGYVHGDGRCFQGIVIGFTMGAMQGCRFVSALKVIGEGDTCRTNFLQLGAALVKLIVIFRHNKPLEHP